MAESDHDAIREGVRAVVTKFDDDYWLAHDDDGRFPHEFHGAMAEGGWLGIAMPEDQGGAGLGVTEAAIMIQEVASHGGGKTAQVANKIMLLTRTTRFEKAASIIRPGSVGCVRAATRGTPLFQVLGQAPHVTRFRP